MIVTPEIFSDFGHSTRNNADSAASGARLVPLASIVAWAGNPRTRFDSEPLEELAESIRHLGLLCPLTVRPFPQDEHTDGPRYQIVAGERRFRAARLAGLEAVPVIVRDVDNHEALLIAVAENDERVDVNPLDRARSYKRLQDGGMRQEEIAKSLNRKQPFISTYTRLLELPDLVQSLIAEGSLTLGHAKALFRFREFPDVVIEMAKLAVAQGTSVRTLESNDLPFFSALEEKKLIQRLSEHESAFNISAICKKCVFGAYVPPRSWGAGHCLKPEHYHELNEAAKRKAQEEAAARQAALMKRAGEALLPVTVTEKIERASRPGSDPVASNAVSAAPSPATPKCLRLENLRYDEYERLDVQYSLPKECTQDCPCRAQALDTYGRLVEICLQPGRLNSLKGKQTREAQKERKVRFETLRAQVKATHPTAKRMEGLAILLLPVLSNISVAVRREYAATLPPASKFRALLETPRFYKTEAASREAVTGYMSDELLYHARNLVLLEELHSSYENKSDGLPQLRYFLELPEDPKAAEAEASEGEDDDVECDETCAGCGMPFTPDDLGQPFETRANGVRELENGLCVTPDGTTYCTACGKETLFCRVCGATGDEDAVFGDGDICAECQQEKMFAMGGYEEAINA